MSDPQVLGVMTKRIFSRENQTCIIMHLRDS